MSKSLRRIIPVEIIHRPKSDADNLRWEIVAEDAAYMTEVDSDAAYAITPAHVGRPVNVALNAKGEITRYELATSTKLDADATHEDSAWALSQIRTIAASGGTDPTVLMSAINRYARHWDYQTHEQAARRKAERTAKNTFRHLPTHTH